MPKVTRKETSQPLQEVSAMVVDDEALPVKPNFSALSAQEQQKGKVEFRRVSFRQAALHHAIWLLLLDLFWMHQLCLSGRLQVPSALSTQKLQVLQLLPHSKAADSSPGTCPLLIAACHLVRRRYLCHKTG